MVFTRLRYRSSVGLTLAWLLLCGCGQDDLAAPAAGQSGPLAKTIDVASMVTAEDVVSKSFNRGAKPKVVVEVFLGSIEIVAGKDETIQVKVTKRAGAKTKAEAEQALKEISLTIDENQDGIRIVAEPPHGKPFSGGVSAKLEVPAGASLELKTNLSHIDVTGVHGSVRVQNSQGRIAIKDARGLQKLSTSLAGIEVDGPSDQITATNSQGGIVVRGAKGSVDLATSLAQVEVDAPATKVTVKNSQGGVLVRRATGTLDLTTSLAGIDVDAPCTAVTAENSQGSITVVGAKGPLKLTTNLANIVVKAGATAVEAINSQGGISIQGATGWIKAQTSLSPITVEAREAVVDAENSQGSVRFSGSLAAGKHSFRTSLGSVTLVFPAQASFRIDATASLGTITNAFTLAQSEKSTTTNLVGTVGVQPKASIQVNVSQGSVTIEKGK